MSVTEDLREDVYKLRTVLNMYEEELSHPPSEADIAKEERAVMKMQILTLLSETKKKVNKFATSIARSIPR